MNTKYKKVIYGTGIVILLIIMIIPKKEACMCLREQVEYKALLYSYIYYGENINIEGLVTEDSFSLFLMFPKNYIESIEDYYPLKPNYHYVSNKSPKEEIKSDSYIKSNIVSYDIKNTKKSNKGDNVLSKQEYSNILEIENYNKIYISSTDYEISNFKVYNENLELLDNKINYDTDGIFKYITIDNLTKGYYVITYDIAQDGVVTYSFKIHSI